MYYNPDDPASLEKYSSAITLSDMEIFIFPELIYALVLSDIMSPFLWQRLKDPWFEGLDKLNPYRKILRTKQYIMDNFDFNLDLETWGLTTKQREMARFSNYIDESVLKESNALFGYEGDKYYFDIDIRKHFGLDKYTSDTIPYWKTETIEAMNAFKYKKGYSIGAGECVSLSVLYAAALHVIAKVPLDDIYLMATPLHSQNYIDIKDGIVTNNRRIVTKKIWFNGTELSSKARRALQNERVTIVAHSTGYIHTVYGDATISRESYSKFSQKLRDYLKAEISFEVLASLLRQNQSLQRCFQISHTCCGKPRFIEAEKAYHYEHSSKMRIGEETQIKLLHEIDEDEFYTDPIPDRLVLDEIETYFKDNPVSIDNELNLEKLKTYLKHGCYRIDEVIAELISFCRIEPSLPNTKKNWKKVEPIRIDGIQSREKIIENLESVRNTNIVADLAFSAFRDMSSAPWKPFLKAALERNPVSILSTNSYTVEDIVKKLNSLPDNSIYDGKRMAQPDEVWNFGRADGLEKAICLMNILKNRLYSDEVLLITGDGKQVSVSINNEKKYDFISSKGLEPPEKDDFRF